MSCWSTPYRTKPARAASGACLHPGGAPAAQRGRRQPGRIHISGRPAPRPGRVPVRPHHRGIGRHRPSRALPLIAPRPQPVQIISQVPLNPPVTSNARRNQHPATGPGKPRRITTKVELG